MEIQHFSHNHTLSYGATFVEVCYGCGDSIFAGYSCGKCTGMNFGLHKSCAELPRELQQHPLHPSHPLTLLPRPPNQAKLSICDECRNMSIGLTFHCFKCNFTLDVQCASSPEENEEKKKEIAGKTLVIDHFSHHHPLTLAICRKEFGFICGGCQLPLSGPAYCCIGCPFFLHESCLDMPQEILHPFHPLHPLLPTMYYEDGRNCDACRSEIQGLGFSCAECEFNLHFRCASFPTLPLKHKRHPHNLFYCSTTDDISCIFYSKYFPTTFSCEVCRKPGKGSFYRCVECHSEFHFQCLPIPPTVKHERHVHPLTLRQWFIEDDIGQYYCDVCETERNPEHPVYCCVDCKFAAHIECIVSEEELPSENDSFLTHEFEEVNYSKDQKKISVKLKSALLYRSEPEDAELDSEENGGNPENPALVELDTEIATIESEIEFLTTKLEGLIAKVNAITDK